MASNFQILIKKKLPKLPKLSENPVQLLVEQVVVTFNYAVTRKRTLGITLHEMPHLPCIIGAILPECKGPTVLRIIVVLDRTRLPHPRRGRALIYQWHSGAVVVLF